MLLLLLLLLLLSITFINIIANDNDIDILTYIDNKSTISILEFESELIKRNIDILYVNENKTSICHIAATNNHFNLIEYIISKKDLNIKEYINIQDKYGDTCIHKACFNNNIEIVKLLKDNEADIFINTNVGVNPLHSSSYKGHDDIVNLLIKEYKVPINIKTNSEAVPLHYAIGQNHQSTALLLLKLGANVNEVNKDGVSSLHIAIKNNNIELAKILMSFGALVDIKNKEGIKPFDYINDESIKTMLVMEGASYLFKNYQKKKKKKKNEL
jgi:ankyrin repeat protein